MDVIGTVLGGAGTMPPKVAYETYVSQARRCQKANGNLTMHEGVHILGYRAGQ